jgi:CDP-glycerol:poly(glycerophosphate) glycerophosphotransferase
MFVRRTMKWIQDVDARLHRRRSERAIMVNARTAMNHAVMAPVIRSMQKDARLSFWFAASESPDLAREIYSDAVDDPRLTSAARAAMTRFDVYLVADLLWMTLPRAPRRVLMFHGVAGKYANVYDKPDASMRSWDRLFFINRRRMKNFIECGAIDADSPSARLIGYPKLDCLVDGSLSRDSMLCELGIDPAKQTVMYAPTWSPHSSLNLVGEQLVKTLCSAGYTVIVKLHDRSRDPAYVHSGGVDWAGRLTPILRAAGGHLATGSDACPYLAAADVLITDHSSVGFEYLLLDRPVIRIDTPELIEATRINPEYVALLAEASTTVSSATEAVRAVEQSLGEPLRQSMSRKEVAQELFYRPGTATRRAVLEIYDLLELEPFAQVDLKRAAGAGPDPGVPDRPLSKSALTGRARG